MTLDTVPDSERVLSFWIGPLDQHGVASSEYVARWWKKDAAFDERVRSEFGAEHRAVVSGEREGWRSAPRGRLAYVIVLDQFSRNLFRGQGGMFANDARARDVAREAIGHSDDRIHRPSETMFLYMPFMHSEALADQERCIELFREAAERVTGPAREPFAGTLDFAVRHRDIVARFGRFPHRNALLGRPSTAEEIAFLQQSGSSF